MLPSAKSCLIKGGLAPTTAAYATIGCFLGGVISIQIFSRLLHRYIPSHIVDCDHTHEEEDPRENERSQEQANSLSHKANNGHSEVAPLLSHRYPSSMNIDSPSRRPKLQTRSTTRASSFVLRGKTSLLKDSPCYGYSDPCFHECSEAAISKNPTKSAIRAGSWGPTGQPKLIRSRTLPSTKPLQDLDEESFYQAPEAPLDLGSSTRPLPGSLEDYSNNDHYRSITGNYPSETQNNIHKDDSLLSNEQAPDDSTQPHHHHHVPTNAFLAIGLQTSIAIALHKLPEGFITFATNHANPRLGFTVFMALFIHNISEGFAMALPLYLALGSRWKSMLWSSLLGGISQPLGAGIAALWFKIAGKSDMAPGNTVYGCMFAITAGIMASVALQLFSESLGLAHNRSSCFAFAFIGMGILGISFALTASSG